MNSHVRQRVLCASFLILGMWGTASYPLNSGAATLLPTRTLWFTNAAAITLPSIGAALTYPSQIELTGLPGLVSQVNVGLEGLRHTYPDDMDILLVSPSGTTVLLMSDMGGATPVADIHLLFDDQASTSLPNSGPLTSGTFKPSNDAFSDLFSAPAPLPPHGSQFAALAGSDPNGTWSLYVVDDQSGDTGAVEGGWRLGITLTNLASSGPPDAADLSVTMTDSPDPAVTDLPLSEFFTVINSGPAPASGVVLTASLPEGVNFISAVASQGSCTFNGGTVACALGNLDALATATATIVVMPAVSGILQTTAAVQGEQSDPVAANNTVTTETTVNEGPPRLSVTDVTVTERSAQTTNAVFAITLSRASDKTVSVRYRTLDGTATDGEDFFGIAGVLAFPAGTTELELIIPVVGDGLAEPDESFALLLENPTNAILDHAQATATIINDDRVAGVLDHFQWNAIEGTQYVNVPFAGTLTARDAFGAVVTDFAETVVLAGLSGPGANTDRLLISEVDLGGDRVEIANVTSFPVSLAGWRIVLYDWICWPAPCQTFEFPPDAVCPAASLLLVHDSGTPPGTFPDYYTGKNISWLGQTNDNPVAVLLLDPAGQIADFFCAVDAPASDISAPRTIPDSQWGGNPAPANLNLSLTYQRIGSSDQNTSADWQLAAPTLNAVNVGFALPFPGPSPVAVSPVATDRFEGGIWSGSIAVPQPVTDMYLRADDGDGHLGDSAWFGVRFEAMPTADLALTHTAQPTMASVGEAISFTIEILNRGPDAAATVTVVDELPSTATFVSAAASQGLVAHSEGVLTATLGELAAGNTATLSVILSATAPGALTNSAHATTDSADLDPTNDLASMGVWINHPPVVSTIDAIVLNEDAPPTNLWLTVQDVESPAETLLVGASSSNPGLIADSQIVSGGSGMDRSLTLTPSPDQSGMALITIEVSDGQDTTLANFTLTVQPVNDRPVLAPIADQSVDPGAVLTLTLAAEDPDLPADQLRFSLSSETLGATLNPTNGQFSWRPSVTNAGQTIVFTAQVVDDGSPPLMAAQSFEVSVAQLAPVTMTGHSLPDGTILLQVFGGEGPDYSIEGSGDLSHWNQLFYTNSPSLPFGYIDSSPRSLSRRFYRIRLY